MLEVGGYSEHFKYAEDYELWSRLLKVSEIKSLPTALVRYSIDSEGVSRSKFVEQRAVHCRIASQNMSDLLGKVVPAHVVQTLAISLDDQHSKIDFPEFVLAAETCAELYRAFIGWGVRRWIDHAVSADFCDRLMRLVRMLPHRMRPRAVLTSRQLSPAGVLKIKAIARAILQP